jgi:hypothetical protein
MIYDESKVYRLFESEGKTYTNRSFYSSDSIYDCFNLIDTNKLTYEYRTGDTKVILFSGGTRNVVDIDDITDIYE